MRRRHDNVADAACIGVSHDRFGTVPAAFIVPADDCEERRASHARRNEGIKGMSGTDDRGRAEFHVFTVVTPGSNRDRDLERGLKAVISVAQAAEENWDDTNP